MMTPQEAESRVFSKASFGGGYNMAQVDAFLDEILADYAVLYRDNSAMKGKMKVLVDKVEEYRSTEDAMRQALITAQNTAKSIVSSAEEQTKEAMDLVRSKADEKMAEIQAEVRNEELRLVAARQSTMEYVERLKELYTKEMEYISSLSEAINSVDSQPAQPADPVEEIKDRVSDIIAETEKKVQTMQKPEEDESATLVFDRLQFGKDYQLV